jgi:hypothetical protein
VPVTLRIVASAMPSAGVSSHAGCPGNRAEAAHVRMLEALCGDAWVRVRLEGTGLDVTACAMGDQGSAFGSLGAASASRFEPAANDASRCEDWTHAGP